MGDYEDKLAELEISEELESKKRRLRRKRRKRARLISIGIVFIMVCTVIFLAVIGIKALGNSFTGIKNEIALQDKALLEGDFEAYNVETVGSENNDEDMFTDTEEYETEEYESAAPYSEEDMLEDVVDSCIKEMTLEEKVAGLFFVTPEQLTGVETAILAGDGTRAALEEYPVGGIIYFQKNLVSPEQTKEMLNNTREFSRFPIFLGIDEEAGKVTRIRKAFNLTDIPEAMDLGIEGKAAVTSAYGGIGDYLNEYGFDLDFAPVADVFSDGGNKAIGTRSFSKDENVAAELVAASIEALKDKGIVTVAKHFPGQGGADGDTHRGYAKYNADRDTVVNKDLLPFKKAIDVGTDMVMIGHFSAPSVTGDDELPCSLSPAIVDLLRGELGYEGVIITDALNMGAVTDYAGDKSAAVLALEAGADMILMPGNFEEDYRAILEEINAGNISEERINESLARIYRIKYRDRIY